jgi:hypothetical protein
VYDAQQRWAFVRPSGRTLIEAVALFAAAIVYFAASAGLTIEYVDEGLIANESLRVAQGAVPFRDFQHIYGPSVFFLNGLLLRMFGGDLLVIRLSLVLLKSLIAVLVYLVGCRVAARRYALLAAALLIALGGAVVMFTTPYANHYSLALILLAMVLFLALPDRFLLACGLAGACFGVAATFKHTTGAFAFAGFALFLLLDDTPRSAKSSRLVALPDWMVRAARLAVVFGIAAFSLAYLARRDTLWNAFMLFAPGALTLAYAAGRELRAAARPGNDAGLLGIVTAGASAAIPCAMVGAYYAAQGLLPALLFGLVRLPQKVDWFDPFPTPGTVSLTLLAVVTVMLATVGVARRRLRFAAARGRLTWSLVAALPALLLLAAAVATVVIPTARMLLQSRLWQFASLYSWFAVPPAAVWLTGVVLLRRRSAAPELPSAQRSAALLVYCVALTSLLLLYPAADFPHVVMVLPPFAPLLAFLAERFHRLADAASDTAPSRFGLAVVMAALVLWLAAPPVDQLIQARLHAGEDRTALKRATAIHGMQPRFGQVASLIDYLDANAPPQRELVVLNGEQMLYFLAGRRSPLERDEFVFYLLRNHAVSDENAHALFDERAAIERLTETKPWVIADSGEGAADGEVRRVFADLSHHLDAHYETAYSVGPYRVLTWAQ